jgi:hypothetical protein
MASVPFSSNTFVPSTDATKNMMVGYSRNVDTFALNQYMQIIPVDKNVGLYWKWASRQGARVLSTDDRENYWPDGQDAPHGADNLEQFDTDGYRTKRYLYSFALGDMSVKQADWPVLEANSAASAQRMMTARTLIAKTALDSASWSSTGNLMGVNGGLLADGQGWDNGTESSPNIRKTLMRAAQHINKRTIGAVRPSQLVLVVGPALAEKMASSQEIHKYFAYGPEAKGRLTGTDKAISNVDRWGLPDQIAGIKIIVEDAVRVSSAKGATTDSLDYIWTASSAYLLSRPSALVGVAGGKNFSTLQGFFVEESTVEVKNDPDNRRTVGRIITNYDIKVVESQSGIRLVDLTSDDSSGV